MKKETIFIHTSVCLQHTSSSYSIHRRRAVQKRGKSQCNKINVLKRIGKERNRRLSQRGRNDLRRAAPRVCPRAGTYSNGEDTSVDTHSLARSRELKLFITLQKGRGGRRPSFPGSRNFFLSGLESLNDLTPCAKPSALTSHSVSGAEMVYV